VTIVMRRALAFPFVLALVAVSAGACGVSSPSSNRQLDFTGTLDPNAPTKPATQVHNFTVSKNGEFTLRITEWSAGASVPAGLSLGTQVPGGGCLVLQETIAFLNVLAMSGPMQSGQYCVAIFDLNVITAPTTYKIRAAVP
jgi:hypothetical protein